MKVLEVPEVVVGCKKMLVIDLSNTVSTRHTSLSLGNLVVGLRLASVNDIRELDRILNEENGNVVAAKR